MLLEEHARAVLICILVTVKDFVTMSCEKLLQLVFLLAEQS